MHSSLPQQLANFDAFNIGAIRNMFERFENRVLTTCDGVITICEDLARIAAAKCPDTPHEMIENVADDRMVFPAAKLDVRENLKLESAQIALYTGTFETYQGLDLLRDAFAIVARRHPAAHLLLAGGRPEQVAAFRESAVKAGLQDRVTLVGTVHPSEIPSYFEAADLIVSPRSSGTNTPLKIYGYLRSGKPIVATDRLTHTQILSHETAELVPATAQGLADGITGLFESPDRGKRLAASALKFANREFSDADYVRKVVGVYDRVVQKFPNSASPA
jgi:glycosyltransferase involved in cell wall biosynthesis